MRSQIVTASESHPSMWSQIVTTYKTQIELLDQRV